MGVAMMRATIRLRVNPVACDGFGHCAEVAPELLGLDEWGYPVLVGGEHGDAVEVPALLLDVAKTAVRQCPRGALLLERVR
jgi:ferredoxin